MDISVTQFRPHYLELRTQSLRQPYGGALRKSSGQFDGDLARVNVES
jgi:hypothetical protein